jgi:hypothetical protein
MPTLLLSAAIVFALGFASAKLLKQRKPADAATS